MKRMIVALTVSALLLAGCGSSPKPSASRGSESSPGATSPARTDKNGSPLPNGSSVTGPNASGGGSASPAPSTEITLPPGTQDHAPGTEKAPLEVTMGSACVVRGTAQTVTAKSAPGLQVSWATLYQDGKTHQEYHGWGLGVIPPTGSYTGTWTIPPDAPLGPSRTDVAVAGKIDGKDSSAYGHGYFTIAKRC